MCRIAESRIGDGISQEIFLKQVFFFFTFYFRFKFWRLRPQNLWPQIGGHEIENFSKASLPISRWNSWASWEVSALTCRKSGHREAIARVPDRQKVSQPIRFHVHPVGIRLPRGKLRRGGLPVEARWHWGECAARENIAIALGMPSEDARWIESVGAFASGTERTALFIMYICNGWEDGWWG